MNKFITTEEEKTLAHARATYGNKNQILVCMEELNELSCVLAKYPRYEDEDKAAKELHDKVLDELADVTVICNHVQNIFHISDSELSLRAMYKVDRVRRWLDQSTDMQQTLEDRAVRAYTDTCGDCTHKDDDSQEFYDNTCCPCLKAQATEGTAPFKTTL